jgi:inhibitor of cysteine peptidase
MKKSILLLALAGLMVYMGCARQQETLATDPNTITGNISAKVGESFNITLPSNLTTGYSWRMDELKPGVVKFDDSDYKPTNTAQGVVGSGGEEIFKFTAVGAGRVEINFEYVRPWEVGIPPVKKARFEVTSTK